MKTTYKVGVANTNVQRQMKVEGLLVYECLLLPMVQAKIIMAFMDITS